MVIFHSYVNVYQRVGPFFGSSISKGDLEIGQEKRQREDKAAGFEPGDHIGRLGMTIWLWRKFAMERSTMRHEER